MLKNTIKEQDMKRNAVIIFLVCIVLSVLFSVPRAHADSSNCLICHNAMSGKASLPSGVEISLEVNAEKYQNSVHGFLACTGCHKKFEENPHGRPSAKVPPDIAALAAKIRTKAKIDPIAYSACIDCHAEIYTQVLSSVHGENIVKKNQADGALCIDCHGSPHYTVKKQDAGSPANQFRVVKTCGTCHGNEEMMKKYGITSDIMGTYNESFHGRKYVLGHKGVPTCVNCHGSHGVQNDTDPSSPVYGDNRIQTCGQCHKGANEKFISGVSHKPAGPIPHYAEKGLIVLTLSTFAFIVSHVFLDVLSQIRDVIFRRRRTGKNDE